VLVIKAGFQNQTKTEIFGAFYQNIPGGLPSTVWLSNLTLAPNIKHTLL